MNIEHLVISSGTYRGIKTLGSIKYLLNNKHILIENIKSIYSTSAGSIIGLILCLKIDINDIVKYVINKPWNNYINYDVNDIIGIFYNLGICDISFFYEIFDTLFKTCELKNDITLKELYEYSNIDFHIFATNICKFELEDFNHTTHPNLKAIEAVYMSSTVPIIFKPLFNNPLYLDGGFLNLYPIEYCLDKYDKNTILGLMIEDNCNLENNSDESNTSNVQFTNILEYMGFIMEKVHNYLIRKNNYTLKYEIIIKSSRNSINELKELFVHKENRQKMIGDGIISAQEFIKTL
tara:strand:- start:4897 stop:5775 length:879 start_codon:yes stop_codon:yes gene_type:complete